MGVSRDSRHKRRATGGRMPVHKKKRAFEKARPLANTKLIAQGKKRVHVVRVRGGNEKYRALRLYEGNFSWPSQNVSFKTRIQVVKYNASSNELVRTKTLVKNAIVQVDATPFIQWYLKKYGVDLSKKQEIKEVKQSHAVKQQMAARVKANAIDSHIEDQVKQGKLLCCISSRPGQSGRADGYILEGKELEFYVKKIDVKKK